MSYLSKTQYKRINRIIPIFEVTAYSGFTNQPANDDIEIVSDSASDTQLITVLYYDNSDDLQQETTTLTGTSPVTIATTPKAKTVLGAFLGDDKGNISARAVGTITIREASGDLTITTISAGELAVGVQRFYLEGQDVVIEAINGNAWYNPHDKVVSTTGAHIQMTGRMSHEINVTKYLTFISDNVGATVQILITD
ncbi:MAG: hypothetical protein ACFFDF_00375 [Candidatus Odinarchaeota archaeon]